MTSDLVHPVGVMATRGITWPALVLFGLSWGTFLAGIILLQLNCNDGTTGQGTAQVPQTSTPDNLDTMGTTGVWGFSGRVLPCTRLFRFYWFMIAFGLVTLVGAAIAGLGRRGLRRARPFFVGMFAVNAVLFMIASEAMWTAYDVNPLSGTTGLRVAIAGAIATAAAAIFVMLAAGTDWEHRSRRHAGRDPHAAPRYHHDAGAPYGGQGGAYGSQT
ncbi:MAG: hypothetical protein J3K34DRAFT_525279 [Monoraphidium minutum]|nr:MAG: hypothetical protein J3K34DRAFT_525279 [Monoraphidium minutum]